MDTLFDEIVADAVALSVAEAERRLEEPRTGRVKGIDPAEAFRKAHEALER